MLTGNLPEALEHGPLVHACRTCYRKQKHNASHVVGTTQPPASPSSAAGLQNAATAVAKTVSEPDRGGAWPEAGLSDTEDDCKAERSQRTVLGASDSTMSGADDEMPDYNSDAPLQRSACGEHAQEELKGKSRTSDPPAQAGATCDIAVSTSAAGRRSPGRSGDEHHANFQALTGTGRVPMVTNCMRLHRLHHALGR